MNVNFEIDIEDWSPEDQEFQQYIKSEVIRSLAYMLKDQHMNSVMNEIGKSCVEEARLLLQASVRNVFNESIEVEGEQEPLTMQDLVRDQIKEWRSDPNKKSYSNKPKLDPLLSLVEEIVFYELNKETAVMLREVKTEAIAKARQNISDALSRKLFDGENLLKLT